MTMELIDPIKKSGHQYVVTHQWEGFQMNPDTTKIKILVEPPNFPTIVNLYIQSGFKKQSDGTGKSIPRRIFRNPMKYGKIFLNSPVEKIRKFYQVMNNNFVEEEQNNPRLVNEIVLNNDRGSITIQNHLGYVPYLWDNRKLRINPLIENDMFEQSIISSDIKIANPPFELIDLLCEGIYDYEGAFPSYHKQRASNLWVEVNSSSRYKKTFMSALNDVFYGADEVVIKGLDSENYDDILENIIQYSNY